MSVSSSLFSPAVTFVNEDVSRQNKSDSGVRSALTDSCSESLFHYSEVCTVVLHSNQTILDDQNPNIQSNLSERF